MDIISDHTYVNRYKNKWCIEHIKNERYLLNMSEDALKFCRFGGMPGKDLDKYNLGYIDPVGGPFITIGDKIDDKPIMRIMDTDAGIVFDVAEE